MAKLSEQDFTFKRLKEHYERAKTIPVDLNKDKCVIFSDAHKWDRGKKDFFKRNEELYLKLLEYYNDKKYILIMNGDLEEGHGSRLSTVVGNYEKTFLVEKKFKDDNRYYRIYGNHDHDWKDESVRWELLYKFFGLFDINCAYKIGEKIFIVHGHEGDTWSDQVHGLTKIILRVIKKPIEKLFGKTPTPARNYKRRNIRELLLSDWAEQNDLILIAGHTHRPMFQSLSVPENLKRLRAKVSDAKRKKMDVSIVRMEKEYSKDKEIEDEYRRKELYFNTGACIFGTKVNGEHHSEITCIEIVNKKIKLLKWEFKDGKLESDWEDLSIDIDKLI